MSPKDRDGSELSFRSGKPSGWQQALKCLAVQIFAGRRAVAGRRRLEKISASQLAPGNRQDFSLSRTAAA